MGNNKGSVVSNDKFVQIDQDGIRDHLREIVRGTVEETLNKLLDAEADEICKAGRYERNPDRQDTRAGFYQRKLETQSGSVKLKVPKLRKLPFETSIIQRYRRRETSVEEAIVEMYLAGVSVRRVENITEVLWGSKVSSGTLSNLNKKVYTTIKTWLSRPLESSYRYVYLDGIYLKRSWGGEVRNVAVLVGIGVNSEGFREIIGVKEGLKEDKESWRDFLRELKSRGLKGEELIISDKCPGLIEVLGDFYTKVNWQWCTVHFYRNVFKYVPHNRMKEVAYLLKAIHAQEDLVAAQEKAAAVVRKLREWKLTQAANTVENGFQDTLSYYSFPQQHWTRIRTNNTLERLMKEIRRRTRVVGAFPDGESAVMLVAARLRHVAGSKWGERVYLDMKQEKQKN